MRRILLASIVLASCRPDLPSTPTDSFVTAVFDPQTAQVPLPNDLVFFNDKKSVCTGMVPPGMRIMSRYGGPSVMAS